VMTPDPVTASTDTPVEELAGMMLDQIVRRIPIVEAGRLTGIVSASDIIQVFLNLHDQAARAETAAPTPVPAMHRRRPPRRRARR